MKGTNASLFVRHARAEESMLRAVMPKASAASPEPLFRQNRPGVVVASSFGINLVKPLTFKIAEVANA